MSSVRFCEYFLSYFTLEPKMSFKSSKCIHVVTLILALVGAGSARADEGSIRLTLIKAGFFIGGSAGSGTLSFHGKNYRVSIGGLSYGLTFGGSETYLRGRVRNIRKPSDVEGIYGAGSAGAAVVRGPTAVVLTNQKGAVLEVSGIQKGLILNLDLSGMALTLR
jgi:hypothetical protein